MLLEGVVTNVTNFGAFVDVGVHQDGLVHISMMSHKFVKDPREVVKTGDVVRVKVLEVDVARKRIALSMRLDETAPRRGEPSARPARGKPAPAQRERKPEGAMAEALARALHRRWGPGLAAPCPLGQASRAVLGFGSRSRGAPSDEGGRRVPAAARCGRGSSRPGPWRQRLRCRGRRGVL